MSFCVVFSVSLLCVSFGVSVSSFCVFVLEFLFGVGFSFVISILDFGRFFVFVCCCMFCSVMFDDIWVLSFCVLFFCSLLVCLLFVGSLLVCSLLVCSLLVGLIMDVDGLVVFDVDVMFLFSFLLSSLFWFFL